MSIVFGYSSFAWLAIAFAVLLPVWGIFRHWRRAEITRAALALALLALALSQPVIDRTHKPAPPLALVDVSQSTKSIRPSWNEALTRYHPSSVVSFASGVGSAGSDQATNIAQALSAQAGPVLLFSDGYETVGDALGMTSQLRERGVTVFPVITAGQESGGQVSIAQFYAPQIAGKNGIVLVRATLENKSAQATTTKVRIKQGEQTISEKSVTIAAHSSLVVSAESKAITDTQRFVVELPEHPDVAGAVAYVSERKREHIALVKGSADDGEYLEAALRDRGYTVDVVSAGALATFQLAKVSALVLNNVARDQLPSDLQKQIPAFVKGGGGLMMIGGGKSFGLGGYRDSEIGAVLPVESLPPQGEKKRLTVGLALVLDKSGSMAQSGKIDFTKEAARETIRNLKDEDTITVIGFDDAPFVVIRPSLVRDVRAQAEERISRLFPAGRTNLIPALDEARRALSRIDAGRKHIIVMTDGRLPDESDFYFELLKQMRLLGITCSTVLVGGDSDFQFLKSMAEVGGGGFYQTSDARSLPRIFVQDVKVSTGERTMREGSDYATMARDVKSVTEREFPRVKGFVGTDLKRGATLEVGVQGDDGMQPLLASWTVGQGRAVAYTSDVSGRWSKDWVQWDRFDQFWQELVASLRSKDTQAQLEQDFELRHTLRGDSLILNASLFDATGAQETVTALVQRQGDATQRVSFKREAPGRYSSSMSAVKPGTYQVTLLSGGRELTPVSFEVPKESFVERDDGRVNVSWLSALADATGGRINPPVEALTAEALGKTEHFALQLWLILAAFLVQVIGILIRER